MTNQILLNGCAPEPLIHYLKALGVFRLVTEQLDPQARGAWLGDTFALETYNTADELVGFFLNEYKPTPLVSPWNGGSGFYDGDDISGREAIRRSESDRLKDYRDVINDVLALPELPSVGHLTVQDLLDRVEQAIAEAKNKESKDVLDWTKTVDDTKESLLSLKAVNPHSRTVTELEQLKDSFASSDKAVAKNPSVPISLETLSSNSLMSRAKEVFNVSRLVIIIEARESITHQGGSGGQSETRAP